MRFNFYSLLIITLFLSLSCDKDNPVSTPPTRSIAIYEYGSGIDSAYYKEWSDGSWERFNRILTINEKLYITIITSDSFEYYYGFDGYAGFKPKDEPIILFDSVMTTIPDTLIFGKTYTTGTTFWVDGFQYTITNEQSIQDTMSVTVPVGNFSSCLWLKIKSTISVADQSQTSTGQVWLAKGPGDIKQVLNSGATIEMVGGVVNGISWGSSFAKKHISNIAGINIQFLNRIQKDVLHKFIK